jgi:hypothetical protein
MTLDLLRRQLAQPGNLGRPVKTMDLSRTFARLRLLYPPPPGSKTPSARTVLSDMNPTWRNFVDVLGLERYRHS